MANERFWFIFNDQPNTKYFIDEPINFGDIDFNLDQKENGMGRDVSLSGGKVQFKFTLYRNHYLEKLLYFAHKYGFEADVKLFIELENGEIFSGELDFYTSSTNDFNYFDCSVILESSLQIFKRRAETKIDLFSSVDTNGEAITPLQPINMLLQSKPALQTSKWDLPSEYNITLVSDDIVYFQVNPCVNLVSYELEDSFTFYETSKFNPSPFNYSDFLLFTAKDNLKNININITDLELSFNTDVDNGGNGFTDFTLEIRSGLTFETAIVQSFLNTTKTENQSYSFIGDVIANIPSLIRGESVWIFFNFKVRQSAIAPVGTPIFEVFFNVKKMNTSATAESTSYNSIAQTFRLIDVMKQIAKSNSGLDVFAPRYDVGGEFYDTIITNGNLIRNIQDKPFYVSWDDIEKSINPEHNADNEIQIDGRVFVGIEKDFYTSNECGFFDKTQFSGLKRKPNPMYCLNKFTFKYAKYQSLKENTQPNSESTIHGESQLTPYNQKVENSKEASVQWVRDAILLDVQQRASTIVSENTSTQDDDTIFAIDTIATESDQKFTESTKLQHTFDGTFLSLRSNGEVNFIVLGIKSGTNFSIQYPDINFGNYTVHSVSNTELLLTRVSFPSITSTNDGLRLTKYEYEIKVGVIPLTNRTNQGFSYVLDLTSPERYSNLRYSVQRNIRNYYNSFLATVNLYWKDKQIKNTFYKNNGKCSTEYAGLAVIEKEDFIPTDPIVTPYMYEDVIFANVDFSDFIMLQNMIRTKRGFIRTIDNNNRVLKLYPIKMSYENKSRELNITGQEKYEKTYLKIVSGGGLITINNETKLRKLTYEIEDNKVVLFDLERQRLYNGIYWDKVTINNQNAKTLEILKSLLDLL